MIHKWLEEWCDTLLYLGVLIGALFFFMSFWSGQYQIRYAEIVMQDFLIETTKQGKIISSDYEKMIRNLENINSGYDIEIKCTKYVLQPVYSLFSEEEIRAYYMGRNTKKEKQLMPYQIIVEEETEENLFLQTETNATILAAEQEQYVSLPEEGTIWSVEAVRPVQEVYEGENLISLCRINSQDGSYYAEAETVEATTSGIVWLQLEVNEDSFQVPVEVVCHPRRILCERGHEIINSKAVIAEYKRSGKLLCSYCEVIPEYIACDMALIQKKTGEKLCGEDVWTTVKYLDGHTEKITPETKEWQDTYDENYCGIQQVIIRYRGMEDTVMVVSENDSCRQCNQFCNERCYQDYIKFPYCIECMSKAPLFSGKVHEEEQQIMTKELLACLDRNQELLLQRGDFVSVVLMEQENQISFMQEQVKQDGTGEK